MNAAAIITMIVIAGFVWGGFITIVAVALRRESTKTE